MNMEKINMTGVYSTKQSNKFIKVELNIFTKHKKLDINNKLHFVLSANLVMHLWYQIFEQVSYDYSSMQQ